MTIQCFIIFLLKQIGNIGFSMVLKKINFNRFIDSYDKVKEIKGKLLKIERDIFFILRKKLKKHLIK